ncbi:shikimate dehydrogenase [Pseudodesulfovibrio sp. F-1]|uniref:Shikimate dehydrogenase (NADP(+)) n=1 Tax=Pseudodesulfovibrio alkaliphilus TaxID=2661613 RepID=A0A7K1KN55_9BACT|nr:shikimate dehydrogenase [Pseudodesulfovibrio alkaliphilus]MUM77513.1 shikimate dehydrogenase [Pseudodesulfovibrio alkaliphilus]
MTARHGIIGWPLGHTLSPALHNWGFASLGLDADYQAWPTRPDELAGFIDRVREQSIRGVSVTIPHKRTVMPLLDRLTRRAQAVGAVNTLFWCDGLLWGENTDVTGLAAPLRALEKLPDTALVLGAGGAARAAVAALAELGMPEILVANRTPEKAHELARDLSARAVPWETRMDQGAGLVCNTTPLGMSGELLDATPWDALRFTPGMIVYDIVYNPLRTRLLREAEAAGCVTVSGLEMFLHQGLAQFRLWTGREPDEAGARALLLNRLARPNR